MEELLNCFIIYFILIIPYCVILLLDVLLNHILQWVKIFHSWSLNTLFITVYFLVQFIQVCINNFTIEINHLLQKVDNDELFLKVDLCNELINIREGILVSELSQSQCNEMLNKLFKLITLFVHICTLAFIVNFF